jgi:hypothetical protein
LFPAGTTTAPAGGVSGPVQLAGSEQILAGGAVGHPGLPGVRLGTTGG